ncbi:MAG: hypothetical protein ACR2NB_09010 [Solirubrobacteraceae bacterium]
MVLDGADPARAVDLPARFTADRNRHLAVVGAGVAEAVPILQWSTLGLTFQLDPAKTSFTVLDLLRDDDEDAIPSGVVAATTAELSRLGHDCTVIGPQDAAATIMSHHASLDEASAAGTARYIVGFGMDRAPRMNQELEGESKFSRTTPMDSLRALLADGAINGTHVLGWWTTLDAFSEQVARAVSSVGMLAFLKVPQRESRSVIPAAPDWEHTRNRALWFDRDHWTTPTPFVPYAVADAADLESFLATEAVTR